MAVYVPQYTMSLQATPKFLFPNSYFFSESTLPNDKHPWFELFRAQVQSNVHNPRSQALIDYPVGFEELAGYSEEKRRRLWKDCKDVYDRIKADKVKAIMDQNAGMFLFHVDSRFSFLKLLFSCRFTNDYFLEYVGINGY
jgi:hypothetical protein